MKRYIPNRRRDRRKFAHTASLAKCKKINISPRVMRGGIRL